MHRVVFFIEPEDRANTPTLDVYERPREQAQVSSRRTSPYKVELLLGEEELSDQDFVDLEEETPLIAPK
eukprot:11625551-Prorocentrum_lima.AAC.1